VRSRSLALGLALATAVGATSRAHAYVHLVRQGESLAQIAERVYGDPKLETVLAGANALDVQGGSAIVVGMRLEIPAPGHRRAEAGETWASLALELLGDARRAEVLARENGGVSWVPPAQGQEVRVPFVLTHIAAAGDTSAQIARRYYGDANRGWLLDEYNFRKPGPLLRGEVVLVPLVGLTLTPEGKREAEQALGRARSEAQGQTLDLQRRVEGELPGLLADLRQGRWVEVVAKGNRLLGTGDPTKAQLATIHRALLEAYVALDAQQAATAACQAWRATDIKPLLDPTYVSPKIRAACGVR
jgi:LysM repeat protein